MTRDEYAKTDTAREKRAIDLEARARHLQTMQQAEVSARALTGNQHWDVFLSYIQAYIEGAEQTQRNAEARLADPMVNGHAEMLAAKIAARECAAAIETAQAILQLPKDIMDQGEEAKSIAERLKAIQELEAKRESEAA